VTAPVELWVGNWLASFDGRVFEVFSPYQEGSTRYHVMLMVDFRIDGSTLTADLQRNDIGLWPFTEEQRPAVESLVAQVAAVRAGRPA
jgi:hypothetical protein